MRPEEAWEALAAAQTGRRDLFALLARHPVFYGSGPDGFAIPAHLLRGYAFWRKQAETRGGWGPEPVRAYLLALHDWQLYRARRRVAYAYACGVLGLRGIAAVRFAEVPASRRPLSAALLALDVAIQGGAFRLRTRTVRARSCRPRAGPRPRPAGSLAGSRIP